MNILLIADVSIANVVGGAERVLFEQGKRLSQRGHKVHLLTRKLHNHINSNAKIQGVHEFRYPVDMKNSFTFLHTTRIHAKALFNRLCEENTYDCVNIYQPFTAYGAFRFRPHRKLRAVYTCFSLTFEEFISRNTQPVNPYGRIAYAVNVMVRKHIEKAIIRNAAKVVVLSEYTKRSLTGTYRMRPTGIKVIPGGVDLKRFYPINDKHEIRNQLDLPDNKVILFCVRNLVERMGLGNLIHAFSDVTQKVPDIFLVIGGEGPLKERLHHMIKERNLENHIKINGFISETDLPAFYRMADLFVLPTKELEGFGLVTLEAMASGVPVLGTPVGGTLEILGRFDLGLLFKNTTAEAMAELIIEKCRMIKDNPDQWAALCDRCRRYVEENYSWDKNVDAMEAIFHGD